MPDGNWQLLHQNCTLSTTDNALRKPHTFSGLALHRCRYHSHYLTQYTDGLKGNLLITDPTAKKYVAEPVIDVSDWYHVNSSTITTNAINKVSQLTEC